MLSNKMTFSLLGLAILFAFGVLCAVPSAFADGDNEKDHLDIGVTIAAGESMIDVSAKDGFQIATGRDRENRAETETEGSFITFTVTFSKGVINLHDPDTTPAVDTDDTLVSSGDAFGYDDLFVEAFDKEERSLGSLSLTEVIATASVSATDQAVTVHQDANNPGRRFLVRINEEVIVDAYSAARGGTFEIYKLAFLMPRAQTKKTNGRRVVSTHGVKNLALDHFVASFDDKDGKSHAHFNNTSNLFIIELVDDDEGNPQYSHLAATPVAAGEGVPGVVAITRILDRNAFQPIETGPFTVRIILTEEPKGGLTTDMIVVENGKATALTKGLTLKGATGPGGSPPSQTSELTSSIVNYYVMGTDNTLATEKELPEATGRDNLYHQYVATITPNDGVDGKVTISIKQFADNVLPVPNMYVPLTASQRQATIITGASQIVRDARLKNESLSVDVKIAGNAKVAAAKAAYEVRSKDDNTGIFNLNPNLKSLGKGLVIPANGYLVLARGKTDSDPVSGVVNVDAKISKKLTAAQKLYNVVYDFKLPFPADDLSNFFRNGGSLSLVYADIPEATGSGHGDSKASKDGDTTHADYTGYVGATSTAIAAGSVIISEIMWGLDANSVNSQYIELHNTTAADIGIDHLEWAIAVGSAPAPFTAIDTVNNNPAPVAPATTGYWTVPGSDGVSEIEPQAGFFSLVDIVSMSRIPGSADGTAAASWAASMRPSANLSGRRIGTPGAANVYVEAPTPPTPPPASTAPVATSEDIMISEVMVASNEGRLPQWIELANVSGAEVSLSGWSIDIDNDSDASSSSYRVAIGDVTVGKDQVVLVISKAGRNSGVAARALGDNLNKGDLDSNRIVDVQSQVSPGEETYMLISETAFKLSLVLPPGTGSVKTGDVVGNLGMGWELPMSDGTARSSLVRREMGETGTEIMGTDAAGWMLASDTGLSGAYVGTYYGDKDDSGTPGYDAGGALPVELSKFGAKRDPLTGQVVITWETQSELNNAGFFIKRSQQKNGQFVVVNPTMVHGAGTTSEKQSYTYTDTTAKPNIVYYYQIEDVSLDGNRQTLTRSHRLKGHIGAAGKLTTSWGELKEQE